MFALFVMEVVAGSVDTVVGAAGGKLLPWQGSVMQQSKPVLLRFAPAEQELFRRG